VRQLFYHFFFSLLISGLYAVDIKSTIHPEVGTVGNFFIYEVWIDAEDTISVIFPQLKLDDEFIEIVRRQEFASDDPSRAGVEFQLRFWNVGVFEIPTYTTFVRWDEDKQEEVIAPSVSIIIESVIDEESPALRSLISPVPLPPLIAKMKREPGDVKLLEEGRDTDTVTVYMINPPEEAITVRIFDNNGQLQAKPQEVNFDSENWQKSRSIYISAVNEWKEEGDHSGRISFILLSVDETEDREIGFAEYLIKDRGPFPYWLAARIAAIFILVGMLIWIWLKKTGRLPSRVDVPRKTPPLIIALGKLEKLNVDDLSSANVRTFYFELSQIIREFLENEYFIRVLEMTTEEIREVLPHFKGKIEWEENLMNLLERADKVKFAKDVPDPLLIQSDLASSESIIRQIHREWIMFPAEAALEI
jgi:hypothetical protein